MNRVSSNGRSKDVAVVGHQRTARVEPLAHGREQGPFECVAHHEGLPHSEPAGLEPPAAHQEGIRARAAGDAGGLEIQEQDVAACRPVSRPRRAGRLLTAGALTSPGGSCKDAETGCVMVHMPCAVADAEQAVQMLVVVHALDGDARSG